MFKKVFIFLFISVNLHYVIAMMTGGKTFKSYNELDGEMRDKINYIINTGTVKFNEQVNSMYHYKVESPDDVIKIATQVVEGINYEVEVILKPTGCRKTPNKVDLEECTISQDGKPKKVSISLWERTWMPEPEKKTNLDNKGSIRDENLPRIRGIPRMAEPLCEDIRVENILRKKKNLKF